MAEDCFDLIVLGVGMAGLTAAQKCAGAGWSVAVVDSRPYGGTCALRGCDPKKMLRRGAEIVDGAESLVGKGFHLGSGHMRWAQLMAHKRRFTEPMPDNIECSIERAEVLPDQLSAAVKKPAAPHQFLDELLDIELTAQEERRVRTSLRLSSLPTGQTLVNFDFAFQPSIERSRIEILATCAWIRANETLLSQGPPGVGKTHLAVALGVKAVEHGFGVTFQRPGGADDGATGRCAPTPGTAAGSGAGS